MTMDRLAAVVFAAVLLTATGRDCLAGSGPGTPGAAAQNGSGEATGPRFASPPKARSKGAGMVVEFTANAPTDVAVFIRDKGGRTVRHLVAGVLGEKAPPPLAAGKLDQSLYWDGTDDDGYPVPRGEYRAEVCLGLRPVLDGFVGRDHRDVGRVHGLAVGPKGRLYVMAGNGRETRGGCFRLYDENGTYLRTLMPRSGRLPLERVRPLGEIILEGGEHFPLVLFPKYGSRAYQAPVVAPNGDLIFVNGRAGNRMGSHFQSAETGRKHPRQLLRMADDGGVSEKGSEGPVLGRAFRGKAWRSAWGSGKGFSNALLYLALGPDGRTVYLSGSQHAVFKVKWGSPDKEGFERVVGTPGRPGSGAGGLKEPCGIALDAEGRFYVADRGNHRVACFEASGKLVAELKVDSPRQLAVHPAKRTIYVTSGYKRQRLLVFTGIEAEKPAFGMALNSSWPLLALDARKAEPVLYVGNVESGGRGRRAVKSVIRLVHRGGKLVPAGEVTGGREPFEPYLLGVDRRRELLYGRGRAFGPWTRWNGRSGKSEPVEMPAAPRGAGVSELSAGPHGTVAFHVQSLFARIDPRMRPRPFPASGSFMVRLKKDSLQRGATDRGGCITADGSIYHVYEYPRGVTSRVRALNPDGTVRNNDLVVIESGSAAGIRVDREGNVYVLDHLKPVGKPVPDALKGRVRPRRHNPFVYNYGSVLKFPPGGGRVRLLSKKRPQKRDLGPGRMQFTTAEGRGDLVSEGALWAWYGVSMIQPLLGRSGHADCHCWAPRFDLDEFARVYVPDQLRCRIAVLDTAGNEITSIGRYGNADDAGGPNVPLADPRTVVVSRDTVYVGDMINNYIARARLDYRRRASCSFRVPGRKMTELAAELARRGNAAGARRVRRVMAAQERLAKVRAEAVKLSPELAGGLDWPEVEEGALRQRSTGEVTADDVRAALVLIACRNLEEWPAREARALLAEYSKTSRSPRLRVAVAWALCDGRLKETGRSALHVLLRDADERVRMVAAYALLDRDDPRGVEQVFSGLLAADRDLHELAETAFRKKVLSEDPKHPLAGKVDGKPLAPAFAMDAAAVEALAQLWRKIAGKKGHWYLRSATLYLLALSGRKEAVPPLLHALRLPEQQRNLNRAIAGLGLHRAREAVPDLLEYLKRGRSPLWGTHAWNGDRAESHAAVALARIGDPKSVSAIIELLDSGKKVVGPLARRTLTDMFAAGVPRDECLVPAGGKLVRVRLDRLPPRAELKAAWQAFWKLNADKYEWNPKASQLRRKDS